MTDFETHPIGTAKLIEELEANINLKADFIDATMNQLAASEQRIWELEAKLEALDHAYDNIVQALQFEGLRTDEAEAKLEKVITVLHSIVDQRGYADDPWRIVQSAPAELKGGTNGKD